MHSSDYTTDGSSPTRTDFQYLLSPIYYNKEYSQLISINERDYPKKEPTKSLIVYGRK